MIYRRFREFGNFGSLDYAWVIDHRLGMHGNGVGIILGIESNIMIYFCIDLGKLEVFI